MPISYRKQISTRIRNRSGSALSEMLAGAALFALIAASVSLAVYQVTQIHDVLYHRTVALAVIADAAEELAALETSKRQAYHGKTEPVPHLPGMQRSFAISEGPTADLDKITVTVSWRQGKGTRQVSRSFYVRAMEEQ